MSFWNAVFLLVPLLFLQAKVLCVRERLDYFTPLTLKNTLQDLPDCFLNNKRRQCPVRHIHYFPKRVQTDYILNNDNTATVKYQLKNARLPLNLLKKLPKKDLIRPVSLAAGLFRSPLRFFPINRELLNNNVENSDYSGPASIDFQFLDNKVATTSAMEINHKYNSSKNINTFNYVNNILGLNSNDNVGNIDNIHRTSYMSPSDQEIVSVTDNLEKQMYLFNCTKATVANVTGDSERYCKVNTTEKVTNAKIKKEEPNQSTENFQLERFTFELDRIDRKFYNTTFNHLISISPPERIENAISFVQSGLFLSLFLIAMSTITNTQIATELDVFIGINYTDADKKDLINTITETLPAANDDLRWRWSFRLVLGSQQESQVVNNSLAAALQMKVGHCNVTGPPEEVAKTINRMVEEDSGGAIHNTFEAEEFSEGFHTAAVIMLYFRARWRSAPTLLNGTRPFRDAEGSPAKSTRMIRINDIMRYANLEDWGCQAIEISYATPGLTLLMLVPDQTSLRNVAQHLSVTSITDIINMMEPIRIGVSMPLYTLRMTLLLPSKLQSMGIHNLVNWTNSEPSELRLSHAIQRIMFWAEAGRNAFKDDGIEWDETPELELMVDRPYLFYVRWHNLTLMNGNFVL